MMQVYEYRCHVCGGTWLCPDVTPLGLASIAEACRSPWVTDTTDWACRHARSCGASVVETLESLRMVA